MKMIPLTREKFAQVDDEDYELLSQYKWSTATCGNMLYATRGTEIGYKKKTYRMHTVIMNPEKGMIVDHIDHNGLNNQRSNLRVGTHSQNHYNSNIRSDNKSGYKGVHHHSQLNKWVVQIKVSKGKTKHIGTFDAVEDAARAYDDAAKQYYGEFAKLNFNE